MDFEEDSRDAARRAVLMAEAAESDGYVETKAVVVSDEDFERERLEALGGRKRTCTLDETTHPWEKERARTIALSVASNMSGSSQADPLQPSPHSLASSEFQLTPETAAIPIMSDEDFDAMVAQATQNRRRSSTLQESTHPWEKEKAMRMAMAAATAAAAAQVESELSSSPTEMSDEAFDSMVANANKGRRRSSTLREDTHPWEKEKAMDMFQEIEASKSSSGSEPGKSSRRAQRRPSGTGLPSAGPGSGKLKATEGHTAKTPVTPQMFAMSLDGRDRSTTVYGGETTEGRAAAVVARAHGEDPSYVKAVPRGQHSNLDNMLEDTTIRASKDDPEPTTLPEIDNSSRPPEQAPIPEDEEMEDFDQVGHL